MKKKIISLFMTVLFGSCLIIGCAGAKTEADAPAATEAIVEEEQQTKETVQTDAETVEIQLLATSDLHGKMLPYDYALDEESTSGSLAQISTIIKELRTDNTILIDNGDTIQGNSAELFLQDEIHPMIQGLNEIGYDIWVAGNHEFNFGMDTLEKVIGQSKQTFLCGNVYNPDGSSLGEDYTIIEKDGVKIGLIGMVTPNITRWDAANLADCKVTDPVEETKEITFMTSGLGKTVLAHSKQ